MAEEKLDLAALAGRIYDLDERIYTHVGSSLGRVYNEDREREVKYIVGLLESKKGTEVLRAELALIGNMAKTMEGGREKAEVMEEYVDILAQTKWQADHYTRIEILDESRASLNSISLAERFSAQDKKIICIGRTYGSAGNEIGFALAHEQNLQFYDKNIFMEILKRMSAGHKSIWENENIYEKMEDGQPVYSGKAFSDERQPPLRQARDDFFRYHGLPKRDALFFTQSHLILDLAKKENFVIMGRYADVLLANENIPHISIFITAPIERRVERLTGMYPDFSEKQIRKILDQSDSQHMRDYRYFTGQEWGRAENYDLTINSASYGVSGSVALLLGMLEGESDYT